MPRTFCWDTYFLGLRFFNELKISELEQIVVKPFSKDFCSGLLLFTFSKRSENSAELANLESRREHFTAIHGGRMIGDVCYLKNYQGRNKKYY